MRPAFPSIRLPRASICGSVPVANSLLSILLRGVSPGSDNANSLVLRLSFQGRTLLLPGDLEAAGLERLFRAVSLDCDLAMAPHHGSQLSRPADFSAWAKPEWIVISGGSWRDTSAAENTFSRFGIHVLHTAYSGAVRVTLRAGQMRVERWRQGLEELTQDRRADNSYLSRLYGRISSSFKPELDPLACMLRRVRKRVR